jgi:hypothetical protein
VVETVRQLLDIADAWEVRAVEAEKKERNSLDGGKDPTPHFSHRSLEFFGDSLSHLGDRSAVRRNESL